MEQCIGIVRAVLKHVYRYRYYVQTFRSHMIAPCSTLTKRASISSAIIATISAIEQSVIMNSSLPNATGAGDEQISQRQQGLDIAVDTAKDTVVDTVVDTAVDTAVDAVADTLEAVTVDELVLHPAAAIFRDETLAGVGDENAGLEDNNSRFRHLPDFSQQLDITFSTSSCELRERVHTITYHKTMCVQTHLSHGSVELVDGNERLVIPINEANAHPIDDWGTIGNISSCLATVPYGSFPSFGSHGGMMVEDDGSIHLTLRMSPRISIEGRLDAAIPNDALAAHIERVHFINVMLDPFPLSLLQGVRHVEKGITFTPTSISMSLTPRIQKIISLSSGASSPSDSNEDQADKLRGIVVDALGESGHKELLNKNLELKCESAALTGIRRMILGIYVSHSAGAFSVSLEESYEVREYNRRVILLDGREDFPTSVPVADLGRIGLSFSGTQLVMEMQRVFQTEAFPIFFHHDRCRSLGFVLVGLFNWDEFSDEEISDIVDDFDGKMRSVFEGNGEDVFPERMTFRIKQFICPPMKGLLKKVGLLEDLDSNADE